jgi:hypothetical protein
MRSLSATQSASVAAGLCGNRVKFGCGRRRNRSWPEALKREIVAALFEPGASVSVVARRYEVNADQAFWLAHN